MDFEVRSLPSLVKVLVLGLDLALLLAELLLCSCRTFRQPVSLRGKRARDGCGVCLRIYLVGCCSLPCCFCFASACLFLTLAVWDRLGPLGIVNRQVAPSFLGLTFGVSSFSVLVSCYPFKALGSVDPGFTSKLGLGFYFD